MPFFILHNGNEHEASTIIILSIFIFSDEKVIVNMTSAGWQGIVGVMGIDISFFCWLLLFSGPN